LAGFLWLEKRKKVTNRIAAFLSIGSSLGERKLWRFYILNLMSRYLHILPHDDRLQAGPGRRRKYCGGVPHAVHVHQPDDSYW
jgi:hypothetical protein